jgi:UDP-N-acetylmuramoylalanine--D-glutamate ligase
VEKLSPVNFPKVSRDEVCGVIGRAQTAGVVVCGLGLTGIAAVRLFQRSGIRVNAILDDNPQKRGSASELAVSIKAVADEEVRGSAFALFSPGIHPGGDLAQSVFSLGIPSLSELDLLGEFVGEPLVGVTGTNGKSTTATLIGKMLEAEIVGNIGTPFIELIENLSTPCRKRRLVAELSSYQLEYASSVAPQVGAFLNLAENHLERHGTMERYFREKLRLIESSQTIAVLCADDERLRTLQREGRSVWFGQRVTGEGSVRYSRAEITAQLDGEVVNFDLSRTRLIGAHNRANLAAAAVSALLCSADRKVIQQVIDTFPGLEHRLEVVPTTGESVVINDSKATTPHATLSALNAVRESFPGREIVLMLGGQAKDASWNELAFGLGPEVKHLIGFGGDGERVVREVTEFASGYEFCSFNTLRDALHFTLPRLKPNQLLLFAPGCASFDEFSGFEERGREFKRLLREERQ